MVEIITRHIKVPKTAKYCVTGTIKGKIQEVWFVCHGYGQLAQYFIRKFHSLDNGQRLIVAPEALMRYYTSDFPDPKVGATWMTKEERLNDIKDYVNYLNMLHDIILKDYGSAKVVILGFSQGVATATRWAGDGHVTPERLILWSGMFPPDMDTDAGLDILRKTKITLVSGKQDKYQHAFNVSAVHKIFDSKHIHYDLVSFEGGHDIDNETLQKLGDQI